MFELQQGFYHEPLEGNAVQSKAKETDSGFVQTLKEQAKTLLTSTIGNRYCGAEERVNY